jgi:hypothetical protein
MVLVGITICAHAFLVTMVKVHGLDTTVLYVLVQGNESWNNHKLPTLIHMITVVLLGLAMCRKRMTFTQWWSVPTRVYAIEVAVHANVSRTLKALHASALCVWTTATWRACATPLNSLPRTRDACMRRPGTPTRMWGACATWVSEDLTARSVSYPSWYNDTVRLTVYLSLSLFPSLSVECPSGSGKQDPWRQDSSHWPFNFIQMCCAVWAMKRGGTALAGGCATTTLGCATASQASRAYSVRARWETVADYFNWLLLIFNLSELFVQGVV